ncbi:MAG: class I SAM-dependent methyltransferase [Smithellaceae bacterium]
MTQKIDPDKSGLLNRDIITSYLLKGAPWADSHGADPNAGFLGAGLLYYTIAYMLRAKLCVCIGSGGGFVPRLMRQAQRDLGLVNARTVLIDADAGEWSRPDWTDQASFFRNHYNDIEIIIDGSSNVFKHSATKAWKIDYLHIDGDHSYSGSLEDFKNYKSLMSSRGIITFHDTKPYEYYNITFWKTISDVRNSGYQVLDFPWLGSGTAIIQLNNGVYRCSALNMFHKQYIFNFFSTIQKRLIGKIHLLFQKISCK